LGQLISFSRFKKVSILAFELTIVLFLAFSINKITVENNIWLKDTHPDKLNKTHLEYEFHVKEATLVVVKLQDDFFQQKYIDELRVVSKKLKNIDIPNTDIKTPLSVHIVVNKNDTLDILKFDSALKKSLIEIDEYKKRFINSIYNNELVSKNGTEFSILVGLDKEHKKFKYRDQIISEIKKILDDTIYLNDYLLAGATPLLDEIDKKNLHSIVIALALALIAFVSALIVVYRDIIKVFIISISSFSAVLMSINIISYLHINLNSINIIIPVIAITIAVADSIHIMSRFEKLEGSANRLKETFKQTIMPCFLTSLTTMVGFGSFYFSEIVPLKNFASEALFSIGAIFMFSVLGTFVNLYIFESKLKGKRKTKEPKALIYLNLRFVRRWYKYVVFTTILLALFFTTALTNASAETNFLHVFFKPYEKIYKNFVFFDDNFNGTGNFDILLLGDKGEFKKIDRFNQIIKLQKDFEKQKSVIATKSYTDYISMVHKEVLHSNYPTTQEDLAQEILFVELSKSASKDDMLSSYTNFDYSEVRVNIKTPNMNSKDTKELVDFMIDKLKEYDIKDYTMTGNEYFVFKLSDYVLSTQIESIIICLISISILFLFLYGLKLSLFASMANFLPILVTLGVLVVSGNSFDFATVAIAGVAIGFCVDDTIHIMHNFMHQKNSSNNVAIFKSVRALYRPLMITTLILGICFFSFFFSNMVISQKFGLFETFAIVVAFLADMVILPSFILYFKRFLKTARA
jgi:predicted RND superfamily exporter protein